MGFTQGVSGLQAASADLNNIGNNIANSQTTGYKSSSTQFADIYAGARTGLGVAVAGTAQDFSAGSLNTTDRNLDVAIDGGGFFRLAHNGTTEYSRDGQFQQTKDGNLANSSGALLTGYNVSNFNNPNASASVNAGGTPQVIQLPSQGLNARATTQASLAAALDAGSSIKSGASFNANDANTYDWSTPNTVYDSLGNAHSVNMYFTKTGSNQWQVNGQMPLGSEANLATSVGQTPPNGGFAMNLSSFTNAAGNTPSQDGNGTYQFNGYTAKVTGATGSAGSYSGGTVTYTQSLPATQLSFDPSGNLASATPVSGTKPGSLGNSQVAYALDPQNGSSPIDFNFDFAGSTQTAQSFSAGNPSQDGYASGALTGITIQNNGMVTGSYDNGQSVNLAQIALAGFRNENGLQPVSGNAWTETADSGQPSLGTAGTGQFGDLRGGTLEASNVDLSKQLVDMIVSQRNYQANAQTIKAQSQILQTAVQLG
ncbi:flagellar hook-basal body complex protein [Salinisphaera hydrothermalis]|uniref:Flagellar hook protein FlgE n=1 Tax=Salinisphaera hydrothermalis (strain C41B8) TaxID=1304275 RepID=A0A084IMU8_SALHC|nr:flagellar hook-basal body complex protein [Salinisphaera hydrothermalis]KEZ78032.1 flagellar hook protein FlgE [Salinisphaera hydrothermalis C41B8]